MKQRAIALFCFLLLLLMVGTVSASNYTLIVKATPASDGFVNRAGGAETYATKHDGSGIDVSSTENTCNVQLRSLTGTDKWYNIQICVLQFDTSGIGTDTVTGVKLSTYYYDKAAPFSSNQAYGIVNITPTSYGSLTAADYQRRTAGIRLANDIPYASLGATTYDNWTFWDNRTGFINKTGITAIAVRDSWDINNAFTGTWADTETATLRFLQADYSGGSRAPFLTIYASTGEAPDTTPPASITSLTNITTCQNITWQWTNPTDIDFDVVQIYQDNTFLHNVTGNTDFWDPLSESTAYTFSSHTCDTTGNCNTTWVNLTSTTDTCPVPTTSPTTTATTAPPTPTPTPTPLAGCTYFNLTGVTFGINSTDWNVTEGLNTWGVSTFNATQGNVSWWICRATTAPTILPTWQPLINPSTDIKIDWLGLLWSWWWLPVLIFIMILLFRRK